MFRNDLYYRLKVVTVHLPPLRERRDDVVPLMDHFKKMFIKRHAKGNCTFSPAVNRRFYAYDWPGNIRQLRNFVETMVVLDTDGVLDLDDLPPELMEVDSTVEGANGMLAHASSIDSGAQSQLLGKSMHEIEKWAILETLQMTGGNREEAARILQIGARTLYRKLDKYREEEGHAPRSSSIDTTEDNEED
jgi:two-component system response regulator HydG